VRTIIAFARGLVGAIGAAAVVGCSGQEPGTADLQQSGGSGGAGGATTITGGAAGSGGTGGAAGGAGGPAGAGGASGSGGAGAWIDAAQAGSGGATGGSSGNDSGTDALAQQDAADGAPADQEASSPPATIPSHQTITFVWAGGADGGTADAGDAAPDTGSPDADGAAGAWFVTSGSYCVGAAVDRIFDGSVERVPLAIGFQCPCECALPGLGASGWVRAQPGGTAWTWDARGLVLYSEYVDCSKSWPGMPPAPVQRGAPQPVPPGHYVARFAVADALPGGGPSYSSGVMAVAQLCPTTRTISVAFDLPGTGDVTVHVPIR
jgi:hypothetical protein